MILFVAVFGGSCGNDAAMDTRPLVVTSILPLAHWAQAVGGDEVRVLTLLPANANAHTFELLPRQIEEAADASLLLFIGAGLEPWSDKLVSNLRNEHAKQLILSEGEILLQETHDQGTDESPDHATHGHAFGNPHLWLDPQFAMRAVERIRDVLIEQAPTKKDMFFRNAVRYLDSLRSLDDRARTMTAAWTQRRFVADHSSWLYFARRYGLSEAGAIEQQPGREISAREMAALITNMRGAGIRAIFADMRSNARGVALLAEETGARIAPLDPLGGAMTGASYIELMVANLDAMDKVMR